MRATRSSEKADVTPPGAALTFRVLGPLELRVGEESWEVHGGRERMVLAMLLTAPGRVVSVSSLVAGLWGDDPPGGADKAVQTYVSRLRGSLPGHGDGLVLTRSPGYVVAVAPDQVDAEEFRRLAASGRHQLANGSAEEAGSTLRAALDLWRGEAYMEFDAPFATLARTTLDEERVAALADRIEAELMLGRGPELVGELESLVSEHPWQERLWAQLMIALYRSGRQSDALMAFQRARSELREELGVDPGPELRAVERMVLAQDPRLTAATSLDGLSSDGARQRSVIPRQSGARDRDGRVVATDVVCPFKGLAHYEVEDAPYFFGRARLVDRLITRLVDRPLLAVVGPSGSGKSSVLRAGIVARIRSGVLPGSQDWPVVLTHPADARPDLPEGRALVVVDALEEMFTALAPSEQAAYAEWLCSAAAAPTVTVVVALRADYYGRLTAHQPLAELVAANTVPVGPLSGDELREAVEGPLAEAHLVVEPGLTDLVIAEVAGEPGALPLLSAALLSLWEGRRGNHLTLAAYHELGGVRSAVAQLGERFYAQLPPGQRSTARRVLVRLADGGSGGAPVRRRLSFAEVGLETDAEVRAVVDALAAGRLVTLSETQVQVAHEALLREWPRLRTWLEDDEAGERLTRQLAPHALEWDAGGRPGSELYRGHRLASALEWLAEHPEDLTSLETEFLRASKEATEKESADRRRSVRRLRALASTLAVALVLAAVLGGVALSERNEARSSADAAGAAELDADVRALRAQALAEPRTDLALLLAAQAYRLDPTEASRSTMLAVAVRSPQLAATHRADQQLQHVALSGDGGTVAAVGSEGGVYAWETTTGNLIATVPQVGYFGGTSLDLSPDGTRLVVVGIPVAEDPEDLVIKEQALIIDLTSRRPRARTLPGPALAAARFAADGQTLVQLGLDGRVRLVDSSTGVARPGRTNDIEGPRTSLRFEATTLESTPDRRFLVAADLQGGGPVTVWAADSGQVLWSEPRRGGTVPALHPDGDALVLGHPDGRIELVSLPEGRRRSVPAGVAGGVTDVAWSPDGGEFAGAASDGTVTTWDARSLASTRVLRGHTGGVRGVAYSPDGDRLYAAGDDGSVLAWQLSGGNGLVRNVEGAAAPGALGSVISADGSVVASEFPDDVVRLFDVARHTAERVEWRTPFGAAGSIISPGGQYVGHLSAGWPSAALGTLRVVDVDRREQLPYTVKLEPERAFDAAFSGDGRTLGTADDRVVVVRDVRTGRRLAGTARYLARDPVTDLGVDRRGRRVALSMISGAVEVVNVTQGQRKAVLDLPPGEGGTATMHDLTFSPDGRWLAAGSDGGAAVVWDTRSWDVHVTWTVDGGGVQSLAFTEDSSALIIGGGGEASLKELTGPGEATVTVGSLHDAEWIAVASRDDGRVLVTQTDELGVQLWQVGPEALLAHACDVAGRDLTAEEWRAALPDRPYAPTCGLAGPG